MIRRFFPLLLVFFFSSLCLFAEEKKELTVNFSSTRINFDPLHTFTTTEAQLYTAIYEGLVNYNPVNLNPVPAVAKNWDISDDGKVYRFYLRSDARYWDGTYVSARHFRDAWMRQLDPKEKAEYSFLFDIIKGAQDYRLGKINNPDEVGIRVISDSVLEVELEHPASYFLKILCHHSFVPIHPDFLKGKSPGTSGAIPGNGPFYVINRTDNELTLVKNKLYWDADNVEITDLKIIFNDDPVETTRQFNQGKIDWVASGIAVDQVEDRNTLVLNPLFATSYFYFNCTSPAIDNPEVRRGLALLLPWDQIRSREYMYVPTSTLIPKIQDYPDVKGIDKQDVEEGHAVLEKAGYGEGKGLPTIIIKIPDGGESRRIAGLMADAWRKELEVKVDVEEYDYSVYYDELKKPGYTLGTVTWIGDFPDPLTFLQMWTTESNLNDAGYSDREFDALVNQSMRESGKERYETLGRAEELLLQRGVVLPISHSPAINLIDIEDIEGWYPNTLDIHPFKYIRFSVPRIPPGIAGWRNGDGAES